jgi:hypothetical protein
MKRLPYLLAFVVAFALGVLCGSVLTRRSAGPDTEREQTPSYPVRLAAARDEYCTGSMGHSVLERHPELVLDIEQTLAVSHADGHRSYEQMLTLLNLRMMPEDPIAQRIFHQQFLRWLKSGQVLNPVSESRIFLSANEPMVRRELECAPSQLLVNKIREAGHPRSIILDALKQTGRIPERSDETVRRRWLQLAIERPEDGSSLDWQVFRNDLESTRKDDYAEPTDGAVTQESAPSAAP